MAYAQIITVRSISAVLVWLYVAGDARTTIVDAVAGWVDTGPHVLASAYDCLERAGFVDSWNEADETGSAQRYLRITKAGSDIAADMCDALGRLIDRPL